MRDFPVFATENGIGSLVLKEIPYRAIAYIKIQDASRPEAFLEECVDFCRMAGAEHIYATGHSVLERYPLHTAIWKMRCHRESLPQTDASLFPVTERTVDRWQEIYNQKMRSVPNSAYMTRQDMKQLLDRGDGYFVHKDGQLLGLGKASGDRIDAVISMQKGAGAEVLAALSHALTTEIVTLEVASTNEKAISLYTRLGFLKTEELSRWYCIQ